MRTRFTKAAVAGAVVFLLAPVALKFAPPRLIALPLGISPIGGNPKLVLLNPLRDRSPERTAHAFLMALSDGNCEQVRRLSTGLKMPNDSTCEDFPNHTFAKGDDYRRVLDQRLRDRMSSRDECSLWYSDDGYGGNWVALRHDGNTWKVTEFSKMW